MIQIQKKKDCCGCAACIQRCPKQCIVLKEDVEGFLYPEIDKKTCIDCGLCEKVCPVINQHEPRQPIKVYAAKNMNEQIRLESSSGGVFTLLADLAIAQGGVVFGAKFNNKWEVIHDCTEKKEELAAFRGSKYVQSRIGETYKQAELFLKKGIKVLFCGTPCQIAGLKMFLMKKYDNLLTVDFICHGVPSPKVFRMYLDEIISSKSEVNNPSISSYRIDKKDFITNINFRDKKKGWKKYSFILTLSKNSGVEKKTVLFSEPQSENLFMKGFLKNIYLRPSCYQCPCKSLKSGSDLTIADYWGIQNIMPDFDDDKGVSLVMVNSEKGMSIFQNLNSVSVETSFFDALKYNPCIIKSPKEPVERVRFYNNYEHLALNDLILNLTHISLSSRIKTKIISMIYVIFNNLRLINVLRKKRLS